MPWLLGLRRQPPPPAPLGSRSEAGHGASQRGIIHGRQPCGSAARFDSRPSVRGRPRLPDSSAAWRIASSSAGCPRSDAALAEDRNHGDRPPLPMPVEYVLTPSKVLKGTSSLWRPTLPARRARLSPGAPLRPCAPDFSAESPCAGCRGSWPRCAPGNPSRGS
jgi:hypothetical protein